MKENPTLQAVFEDTEVFYKENKILAEAVLYGREHTRLYREKEYPDLPFISSRHQDVRVTQSKTFEAALRLHKEFPDKKIAVLNFASARKPGGGVKRGATAQEESLCRCSTLFPTIDRKWLLKEYYNVNLAAHNDLNNDDIIYSPGVIICKTDDAIPQRLSPEEFVTVDVITCAAPDFRNRDALFINPYTNEKMRIDPDELLKIHQKRACHIFHIAAANSVDILVLGAFGCGVFKNPPHIVAAGFCAAMDEYRDRFDLIEYAVFSGKTDSKNYDAFRQIVKEHFIYEL